MYFHISRPLHGWHAFISEVGIIVLRVPIASSAEQLAEQPGQLDTRPDYRI